MGLGNLESESYSFSVVNESVPLTLREEDLEDVFSGGSEGVQMGSLLLEVGINRVRQLEIFGSEWIAALDPETMVVFLFGGK